MSSSPALVRWHLSVGTKKKPTPLFRHCVGGFQIYRKHKNIILAVEQCFAWVLMQRFYIVFGHRHGRARLERTARTIFRVEAALKIKHWSSTCGRRRMTRTDTMPLHQLIGRRIRIVMIACLSFGIFQSTRTDQQWGQNRTVVSVGNKSFTLIVTRGVRDQMINDFGQFFLVQGQTNPKVTVVKKSLWIRRNMFS